MGPGGQRLVHSKVWFGGQGKSVQTSSTLTLHRGRRSMDCWSWRTYRLPESAASRRGEPVSAILVVFFFSLGPEAPSLPDRLFNYIDEEATTPTAQGPPPPPGRWWWVPGGGRPRQGSPQGGRGRGRRKRRNRVV